MMPTYGCILTKEEVSTCLWRLLDCYVQGMNSATVRMSYIYYKDKSKHFAIFYVRVEELKRSIPGRFVYTSATSSCS
jgi:hypothetical protein